VWFGQAPEPCAWPWDVCPWPVAGELADADVVRIIGHYLSRTQMEKTNSMHCFDKFSAANGHVRAEEAPFRFADARTIFGLPSQEGYGDKQAS